MKPLLVLCLFMAFMLTSCAYSRHSSVTRQAYHPGTSGTYYVPSPGSVSYSRYEEGVYFPPAAVYYSSPNFSAGVNSFPTRGQCYRRGRSGRAYKSGYKRGYRKGYSRGTGNRGNFIIIKP